jgi:hypothetical protein
MISFGRHNGEFHVSTLHKIQMQSDEGGKDEWGIEEFGCRF